MAKRKRRDGEVVCRCGAYPFPHRQFGGQCISPILSTTWMRHQHDKCRGCRMYQELEIGGEMVQQCAVLEGIETIHEAECIMEHVTFHGIKLYGINQPPRKKR